MNFKRIEHLYGDDIHSIEADGKDFESLTLEQQHSLAHKLLDMEIKEWEASAIVGELIRGFLFTDDEAVDDDTDRYILENEGEIDDRNTTI